jgi:hypothetical protein
MEYKLLERRKREGRENHRILQRDFFVRATGLGLMTALHGGKRLVSNSKH